MSIADTPASPADPIDCRSPQLYRADADAVIHMNADDEGALQRLFESVKQRLGSKVRVSCWPYRRGGDWAVALDLRGDHGEVNLNLLTGDEPRLPGVRDCELPMVADDWTVIDGIDAFYLIAALLSVLDALPGSEDWPFLGLKRIAT